MQAKSWLSPGPGVRVLSVDRVGGRWVVAAVGRGSGVCPGCGEESTHRHSWRQRRLQDLPIQGANVTLQLRLSRWRCRNIECRRKTFVEQMPEVFPPLARRTRRVAELVHLFGHSAGGKPGERLMGRLGAPVSDDTILRHLKRRVADRNATTPVRVAGIDDWSWRKGSTYGAIVVDLERREVVDVLPDRSAAATANWLRGRPEVEVVSRDRCGLLAQGAREGAPQARQVADRFHLLQNFRQAIERQLSRAGRRPVARWWRRHPARTKMARPVFVAQAASGRSRSTSISFVMRIGVRGRNPSIKSATFTKKG